MSKKGEAALRAGRNIAMKVPAHCFDETVTFYRNVAGLPLIEDTGQSRLFAFGDMRLWLDRCPHLSHPEIWLEFATDDTAAAAAYLHRRGVQRRDGIEPLPESFAGFWIANPAGVIHLVAESERQP